MLAVSRCDFTLDQRRSVRISSHSWLRCLLHIEMFFHVRYFFLSILGIESERKMFTLVAVLCCFIIFHFSFSSRRTRRERQSNFWNDETRRVNNNNGQCSQFSSMKEWLIYFRCNLFVNLSDQREEKERKIYSFFYWIYCRDFSILLWRIENKLNVVQGSPIEF